MKREPRYEFRAVEPRDLPMLARWLGELHVRQWWGQSGAALAEINFALEDEAAEPLIVERDGRPVGYVQVCDPHLEDNHPYQDQPTGTLGLDLLVGEADLIGHGLGPAILAALADILFDEGAPRLIADPHPDNTRAIRAFEKAGFRHFDTRDTPYGRAHMMALDAAEDDNDA